MKRFYLFLLVIIGAASVIRAESSDAAAMLKFAFSPRAAAMGHAYTAIAEGLPTIFYNPSGLGKSLTGLEIGANSAQLSGETADLDNQYHSVMVGLPTQFGNWGVAFVYHSIGDIEQRDVNGVRLGVFDFSSSLIYLSWGKTFFLGPLGDMSVGLTTKYLSQSFGGDLGSANGLGGFDLGLLVKPLAGFGMDELSLGIVMADLGGSVKWKSGRKDEIDPKAKLGLGYEYFMSSLTLKIAMDAWQCKDAPLRLSLGSEIAYRSNPKYVFKFRAGIRDFFVEERYEDMDFSTNAQFSLGLGAQLFKHFLVDYAYLNQNYGSLNYFGIGYKF